MRALKDQAALPSGRYGGKKRSLPNARNFGFNGVALVRRESEGPVLGSRKRMETGVIQTGRG